MKIVPPDIHELDDDEIIFLTSIVKLLARYRPTPRAKVLLAELVQEENRRQEELGTHTRGKVHGGLRPTD